METKMKKREISKIEKICEKAFGVEAKDIYIYLDKSRIRHYYYLNLDIVGSFPISMDCEKYKPFFWDIYEYTDDEYEKYLAKLSLIEDVIKFYKFDSKTYFLLKINFENGKSKILKKDDYFRCIYFFEKYIYNKRFDTVKDDFDEIYKNKKYNIEIIDNKNNYSQILVEKK